MSPRPSVRVAVKDAYGQVVNEYTGSRRVKNDEPESPWAVYLADTNRRFHLLAFDFDAKTPDAAQGAARDAERVAELLHQAGLESVICQSGPGGGRHVWTRLTEGVPAATVAMMARLVRHICPSLDCAPLSNAVTGCVRPPGAPHRQGGHSTVLRGDLTTLSQPTATPEHFHAFVEQLAALVGQSEPSEQPNPDKALPVDAQARLYLPGDQRELPATSAAALREDAAASPDASAVLWRVLIGAASARWRYAEVAALVATSPGMEHVRTGATEGTRRTPRPSAKARYIMTRQWDKAVRYVATNPRQIGDDPTFDARASAIAAHVQHAQTQADSSAGRWSQGGGPSDRRILDALCALALQAMTSTVEADIRRLALLTGLGRETARTALLRLALDGWIGQAEAAEGIRAAVWKISPDAVIHSSSGQGRSQADPRPAGAGAASRHTLLTTLNARMTDAAHDLFTLGSGLGPLAGNIYARTGTAPLTVDDFVRTMGATPSHVARALDRLTAIGVLVHGRIGWHRHSTERRDAAARRVGVEGHLEDRARRYSIERKVWAWWKAEEAWMNSTSRPSPGRRPSKGQLSLVPDLETNTYGQYPRRADGRADHKAAKHEVIAAQTTTTTKRLGLRDQFLATPTSEKAA